MKIGPICTDGKSLESYQPIPEKKSSLPVDNFSSSPVYKSAVKPKTTPFQFTLALIGKDKLVDIKNDVTGK